MHAIRDAVLAGDAAERPGRETFGASVDVTSRGGVTTCASTGGYLHTCDDRCLWTDLERIVGSAPVTSRRSTASRTGERSLGDDVWRCATERRSGGITGA